MSRDFTLKKYTELLQCLLDQGYRFVTFETYCMQKETLADVPFVILRHDVDLKAANSLATAEIEHTMGLKASYYFRTKQNYAQTSPMNLGVQKVCQVPHIPVVKMV